MKPERRQAGRAKTRLRPGKLLDAEGVFIADCAILDRSEAGARIRLFASIELPSLVGLLDESERATRAAEPMWQSEHQAGLRLEQPGEPLERSAYLSLAGPYYAVR